MMLQDSLFILFFSVVFVCYWLLNHKQQNILLLVASYAFYGFIDIKFLFLLTAQSVVTFYSVLVIRNLQYEKKLAVAASILINIAILGYFKYYNFFVESIISFLNLIGFNVSMPFIQIIFPLGVSFYTFQNISYIVDVQKKVVNPCESLIEYCLYISFFPKLLAGPIERASNFLTQVKKERSLEFEQLIAGFMLFLWGYFQKSVIADNISPIANKIFLLENSSFFILCVGAFTYTMQIFADFSGYTDMARGLSLLLGFKLVANFDNPYLARNPTDFWRRWHISFSEWIRDYIYIPLGGARVTTVRWILNLFIAFFFTGLWHGASWNYVIWGLYYWVLYLIYRLWESICPKIIYNMNYNFIISTCIMFVLTNLGWVIFRETNLHYLQKYFLMAPFNLNHLHILPAIYLFIYVSIYSSPLILFSIFTFMFSEAKQNMIINSVNKKSAIIIILFFAIIAFKSQYNAQFIYLNF